MPSALQILFSSRALSAGAVVLVAMLVGAEAARGMNLVQWLGGLTAVSASVSWAVIERAWPKKASVQVRQD
jgi:general stress protein CsbA